MPPQRKKWPWVAGLAVALILGISIGTSSGDDNDTSVTAGHTPKAASGHQKKHAHRKNSGQGSTDNGSKKAKLPNLVGKGLQDAQDSAQAAGFYYLTSHDSIGKNRLQVMDGNWKVCSQSPKAGSHATDTKVDFGAVKLDESCSGKPSGMTKAKFAQVHNGMTESQVFAITGKCDQDSESSVAGYKDQSYTCWADDQMGNASMLFQNGKLYSKARFGLE